MTAFFADCARILQQIRCGSASAAASSTDSILRNTMMMARLQKKWSGCRRSRSFAGGKGTLRDRVQKVQKGGEEEERQRSRGELWRKSEMTGMTGWMERGREEG